MIIRCTVLTLRMARFCGHIRPTQTDTSPQVLQSRMAMFMNLTKTEISMPLTWQLGILPGNIRDPAHFFGQDTLQLQMAKSMQQQVKLLSTGALWEHQTRMFPQ